MDKSEQLQAIMTAGRRIHETIDTIDLIVSTQLGVHRSDLRCLHMLEMAPATPGEVAARVGLTSGSVTALIDRLESAGFVERRRSCKDRRSVEIALTECRLAEIRRIYAAIEQTIHDCFGDRPVAEIAGTGKALAAFADALALYAHRNQSDVRAG